MAAYTSSGYAVADIAALKAIASSDRPASGSGIYALAYVSDVQWFEFDPDAVSGGIAPDSGTGRWFPLGRETLRANRTYYVRTDGNDNNSGLANTSGGAFLTPIGARNALRKIDGNGFVVTVKFGSGTYNIAQSVEWSGFVGISSLILEGDTTTPTNVNLVGASGISPVTGLFDLSGDQNFDVSGFNFQNTQSNGVGLRALRNAKVITRNNNFASVNRSHIETEYGARLEQIGNMTISGGAGACFIYGRTNSVVDFLSSGSCTITGTPNFGFAFFGATEHATFRWDSSSFSFSGSATGKRHDVTLNAIIQTYALGVFLPGNISGTTSSGGQYV